MMTKVKSGIFFFALSVLIIGESLRLGLGTTMEPGPGFLPFCAGTILSVLALAFVYTGRKVRKSLPPYSRQVIIALVSVFAYSLVLDSLGFIIATFAFLAILFHLGEPRRWWVTLAMSAFVTFAGYFFFGRVLQVFFPQGILGF